MTKEDKLSRAAKALVDAANSDADSMTQQQLTESLTSLKDSFDDKINTVNQNIDKLFSEVKKSNDMSAKQLKLKKLELALAQTHLNSFEYQDNFGNRKNSAELAKFIIGWFILGYGYNLPDAFIYETHYTVESKKAFQDKLVKQIKDLIGREPRVEGGAIYYE